MALIYAGSSNNITLDYTVTAEKSGTSQVTFTVNGTLTGNGSSSNANNDLYVHLRYGVTAYSSTSSTVSNYGISCGTPQLLVSKPLNKSSIPTSGVKVNKTFTLSTTATTFENVAVFLSSASSAPAANATSLASSGTAYMFVGKHLSSSISKKKRYHTETISVTNPTYNIRYHVNGGSITTGTGTTRYRTSSNIVQRSTDSGATWSTLYSKPSIYATYTDLLNVGTPPITKAGHTTSATSAWNTKADGTGNSLNQANTAASDTNPASAKRVNGGTTPADDATVTLYVNWQPWQHTVAYDLNGGTSSSIKSQTKTYGSTINITTTKPTRSSTSATAYTVTLDANGGTCNTASLSDVGTTSYTFKNWNTESDGSGTTYTSGQTYGYDQNGGTVTLYAQWDSSTTVSAVTLPTPTRNGYEFRGWSASQTATSGDTGSYTPTGNIKLYAIWEAIEYSITFDLDGGEGVDNITYTIDSANISLETPTKTGYTFSGWTGSNGTTPQISVTIPMWSTGDKSYTANWTPNTYTIVYHKNYTYATGTTASSTHTYDTSQTLTANGFSNTGHTFLGWHTSDTSRVAKYTDQQSVKNLTTTPGGTVTLYAIWEVNTYTVTYDANGGSGAPEVQTYTYSHDGEQVPISTVKPTKADESLTGYTVTLNANGGTCDTTSLVANRTASYVFSGWDSKADGTGYGYASSFSSSTAADVILYAQYDSTVTTSSVTLPSATRSSSSTTGYTITLNANGGSGIPGSITSTRTASYTFNGWSTSSSATSGATGSYTPTGNVALYSVWESTYQNDPVALPIPTKTGHSFVGWSTANSAASIVAEPYTPSTNTTLYAIWETADNSKVKVRLYTFRDSTWKPIVLYVGDSSNKPKLLTEEE